MADSGEQTILEKSFAVDIAKQGRAACKNCKQKCEQGEMRLAKITPSPYGSGFMKQWHHIDCFFEASMKQRPTTNRLKTPNDDLEGWDSIDEDHKRILIKKINDCEKEFASKHNLDFTAIDYISSGNKRLSSDEPGPSKVKKLKTIPNKIKTEVANAKPSTSTFRAFRKLIADITNVGSYLEKTAHVQKLFSKNDFSGDVALWCRLLLPGVVKRIYNLRSKQLIKLFSRIFKTNHEEMLEDLEQGDVAETIYKFFEKSKSAQPAKASTITLEEVDEFLEKLCALTLEDEQVFHFKSFIKRCSGNDLKYIIRLVKHDLRMNAGAKHILDGVHPKAYESYQACRDLQKVIDICKYGVTASVSVMTPVLPMLAEPCKSVEQAMKKCPNGMYSEIKYDGERVQLHKQGSEFKYFSRSLKPVLPYKISHFKDYIPTAFPHGNDLILDSEILMVDTQTGKPLPFGTLGKHKKEEFKDASVCLFVFDCIYYNGEILRHKPLKLRKKILQDNMVEIKNHIMFSEMQEIHKADDLTMMIAKVLKLGLEGLVLKDIESIYEPGKRHWLKVKKDYLFDGAMADSADLIVLGAWYGTGKKGGMMSVFLMGCYDPYTKKFKTVTKVHTGHDDKTLDRLQVELDMMKISGDYDRVPKWLECTRTMVPDFVAKDPKNQPVWEITGAEFTQVYEVHTADGISIRFPRVTRIRDDKTYETATNLQELNNLYKASKSADVGLLLKEVKSTHMKSDEEENGDSDRALESSQGENVVKSPAKNSVGAFPRVVLIDNPLPNYFENVNLLVGIGTSKLCKELLRRFVAYGGVIIPENECSKANYVLHASDTVDDMFKIPCSIIAKHIKVDWIKECIRNKTQLNWKTYAVVYVKSDDS